jgi:SAM-dependent methyltransferase
MATESASSAKRLRDRVVRTAKPFFRVLAAVPLRTRVWVTDQRFLKGLGNPAVGTPSLIGQGAAYASQAREALRGAWDEAYAERALSTFKERNSEHYAPGGRGYVDLPDLSPEQKTAAFAGLTSRLEGLVNEYPTMLAYRDGESFLEPGCGKGQNLKFITRRYPSSEYVGFDIDARCLAVASVGLEGSPKRRVVEGSILDFDFLKSFGDRSFDHVFVSYVFSTLLGASLDETRAAHQRVIDEFVRIARKSVLVLDTMSLDGRMQVEIEQRTRAAIRENIAEYFLKYRSRGETAICLGQSTPAVLFKVRSMGATA